MKKSNKKEIMKDKSGRSKILLIGIVLFIISLITLISFVKASQNQSLEEELASLEQNLSDSGYNWLVNQLDINGGEI